MKKFILSFLFILFSVNSFAEISHIATTKSESSSTTSLNISKPDGVSTGDFLLAVISNSQATVSPAPSGWTLVTRSNTSGANYISTAIYYKWVAAGDPSTYMFQISGTGSMEGFISAFSGVDSTNPIDAFGINLNSSSTSVEANSISPSTSNAYLVGVWSRLRGGSNINSAIEFTSLETDRVGNNSTGVSLNVSGLQLSSSGATGNFTATSSSSVVSIGALVALRTYVDVTPTPTVCKSDFLNNVGPLDPVNWKTSVVGGSFTPQVFSVNSQNRLRMTQVAGNQSTMAQILRYFPGAGNKITVEFDYYVYSGNGADGFTVVFSDASIPAVAGAFGGSLGYAQQTSKNGFAGGWLAVGIDEYGNFPNPNEGKVGYPSGWIPPVGANTPAGFYPNNISIRGSGSGTTGYRLLANTGTLSSVIWNSSQTSTRVQRFRILIDHSDGVHAYVKVERDLTGTGSSYSVVVPKFDAKVASGQAAVPVNWVVSFTGSTGGQNNIHELATLNICADIMYNPQGEGAYNFACLENGANNPWDISARKPLYTKLINTPFTLDVAPLKTDGDIETGYTNSYSNDKFLKFELWENNGGSCSDYSGTPLHSQNLTYLKTNTTGRLSTASITPNKVARDVICRIRECTTSACTAFTATAPGCSSDNFTIKPSNFSNITSSANVDLTGTNSTTAGSVKTGANFTITVDSGAPGYNGTPVIDNTKKEWLNAPTGGVSLSSPTFGTGNLAGSFGTANVATGNGAVGNFTYDEVGYFRFKAGGVYDNSWTSGSNDSSSNDCVAGSSSNTLVGGKYGCNIANSSVSNHIGRFVPDRFVVNNSNLYNRYDLCPSGCGVFTYLNEPIGLQWTLTAQNQNGITTRNYTGSFARLSLDMANISNLGIKGVTTAGPTGVTFSSADRLTLQNISGAWDAGVANGITVTARPDYKLVSSVVTPDGPHLTSFGISPVDIDGVRLQSSALNLNTDTTAGNEKQSLGVTNLRFGQLYLGNVYGSNTRDLRVPIQTRYWDGSGWVVNTEDNITAIPSTSVTFARYKIDMDATKTNILFGSSQLTMSNGVGYIGIQKPSSGRGSFDIGINLANRNGLNIGKWSGPAWTPGTGDAPTSSANLPYLSNDTSGGSNYTNDPASRVTFGIYKGSDRIIDIREQY